MMALIRNALLGCAATMLAGSAWAIEQPGAIPWAQLPVSYRPAPESDEGGLWMIGDRAEQNLRTSPLLVKDPALNSYVQKIVCRLSGPYCASIRVYILDVPHFQAVMAPNGMLQVWTGFLLGAQNEAQISFVLGHEISHYLLKHTVAQYRRIRDQSGAVAVLGALTGGLGNLAALGLRGSANAFSREEEGEADKRGFELAVQAGYDPAESVALWQAVLDLENATAKNHDMEEFAKSHPPTAERLTEMKNMAEATRAQGTHWEVGKSSYQDVIRPFRARWLAENLALAHFDESLAVVQDLLKAEPHSGDLQYALGEIYRRRNADGDAPKALAAYAAAIAAGGAPKEVYRGLGLASLKAGDKSAAQDAFRKYLAAVPDAGDRAMIAYYLSQ